MKWLLAVLVLAGASVSTNAKLGEKREQLISRYGKVVKEENKEKELKGHVLTFSFKNYEVEVIVVSQTISDIKFMDSAEAISFKRNGGA